MYIHIISFLCQITQAVNPGVSRIFPLHLLDRRPQPCRPPAVEGRSYIKIIDTAAILKTEKKPSPAQAGLFDLAWDGRSKYNLISFVS
jgi:hypothetical protein